LTHGSFSDRIVVQGNASSKFDTRAQRCAFCRSCVVRFHTLNETEFVMTNGQASREFAAKLREVYPTLRVDYMSMCAEGTPCRDVIQANVDAQTVNGLVISRKSATWTHTLTLFIDYRTVTITINEGSYVTDRPFISKRERESETVDNVNDLHRIIRSYFD
jgi:hypothetical protein